MNPRLIAGKQLQVATPSRERGVAQATLALLLVAVAVIGFAQRGSDPGISTAQQIPIAIASPAAGSTTIVGTAIPAPPTTFTATATRTHRGTHVFVSSEAGLSPEVSTALFSYYLQSMPAQGWTLLGKGDPTRAGDWTQSWQAGTDTALLTVTTRPRHQLTVQLCPPDPYC